MECSMADDRNSRVAPARTISAVILDYGEVLCFRSSPEALAGMAGIFGIGVDNFFPIYPSSRNPNDRGDLPAHAFWVEFPRRAGVTIPSHQIENLRRLGMEKRRAVNEEITEWLRRLHP